MGRHLTRMKEKNKKTCNSSSRTYFTVIHDHSNADEVFHEEDQAHGLPYTNRLLYQYPVLDTPPDTLTGLKKAQRFYKGSHVYIWLPRDPCTPGPAQ